MDVKKICLAVLVAAAFISAAMAADPTPVPTPGPSGAASQDSAGGPGAASSPGPAASGASEILPVLGSMIGASLVSFLACFLQ